MDRTRYHAYGVEDLDRIPQLSAFSPWERLTMRAVATVLPFRVNRYVVEELIDWAQVPDDPIFRLTFPQEGMLDPDDLSHMCDLLSSNADDHAIRSAARDIQLRLNPHPAGQLAYNRPSLGGRVLPGMQHKYRETVLFFPSQGQTCHAYCTYCFRWAQFVGIDELELASREVGDLVEYLKAHREVSSVLFTGGDPLIMKAQVLRRYIEPLLVPELEHVTSIRIGTKSPAYWPYRFVTDGDADDLLRLFEEVRRSGRHLALMAHFSHPRELQPSIARSAIERIISTGAVVRCQAPLIRGVNDDPGAWSEMWRAQVRLGAVPYYMFVERDTGPKNYFEVPLSRALEIFGDAYRNVCGLARTVRGPSMSATPGKIRIAGTTEVAGERVFVLEFLQARDPAWVGRPFFARYDASATWIDQLQPASNRDSFFFEPRLQELMRPAPTRLRLAPAATG